MKAFELDSDKNKHTETNCKIMNDTLMLCVCVGVSLSAVSVCRLMRNDCRCPDTHSLWWLTCKAARHLALWYLSMNPEVCETISLQTIWLNDTPLPRKLRYPQSPSVELSHREPSGHAVVRSTGSGLDSLRFTLHIWHNYTQTHKQLEMHHARYVLWHCLETYSLILLYYYYYS